MNEPASHSGTPPPISYRPDIDGLRAIAVAAVIAFHAFPSIVHGGYTGVDVFFVISGYLISSILLKNIDQKKFSILDFYSRRVKRIFPALIVVLVATLCIGWTVMLSDEFSRLGNNAAAATLFSSNFWLWHEAGYFDTSSDFKPLLHLWSLAIEEQFYIIWPLLLFLFCKKSRWTNIFIFMTVFFSFLSCIFYINNPVSMFYFPQNRAWELLIGALLASIQFDLLLKNPSGKLLKSSTISNAFAGIGTLLILLAVFALDKKSTFPGWLALLPTLGSALIIAAGEDAWINRYLLSSRLMVTIGLISYPLYLWHWPLLAFSRIMENGEPSPIIRGICIVISIILSWLTYRLLEVPLRHGSNRVVASLITLIIIIGITGYLCGNGTIKSRAAYHHLENIMGAFEDWGYPRTNITPFQYSDLTLDSQGENRETTLFIGDSNMQQYFPRINTVLNDNPRAYNRAIFAAIGSCLPLPNIKTPDDTSSPCPSFMDQIYQLALTDSNINTVVIAASWVTYFGDFTSSAFRSYSDNGALYPLSGSASDGERMALLELERVISDLQSRGKKVFLVLNIPKGDEFDPRGLIKRSWETLGFGLEKNYDGVPRQVIENRQNSATDKLKAIANRTGATVFDPVEMICTKDNCPVLTDEGLPIYKDYNHLNASFVKKHMLFLDQTIQRH